MAYLGKYIRQLLSKQETVTLPGFGSLVARQGKGISSESGGIEPPGIVIVFDAEHPRDDGKLAEAYSEGEGIEFEEARQQVLELVDAIKFKLDKGEVFTIEQLGQFSRDEEFRVRFKKDPNWVIDPELFGLSTIDLLELEDEEEADAGEVPGSRKGSGSESESGTQGSEATAADDTTTATKTPPPVKRRTVKRKPVNKWKIIWIVVGSLIVVLILLLMIPGNQEMKFGREGIILRDTGEGAIPEDPLIEVPQGDRTGEARREADQDAAAMDVETAASQAEDAGTPVKTDAVPEDRYFIIAGSFQGLQNASQLLDELQAKGYPSQIIITENRMYRVAVKSYATKQEAMEDLSAVRSGTGLSGCWVMVR